MPADITNYPLAAIVDGMLSYIQWNFANADKVPPEYRWSPDDRASKIRISAPFVIDNEKPLSAPFVIVERGAFQFANRTLDNIRGGSENTFTDKEYVDWMDGGLHIICGSRSSSEASTIANLIAVLIQGDRHGIMKTLNFVRNLKYTDVGPEIPVIRNTEVRRYEVTLNIFTSLQIGWVSHLRDEPVLLGSANFYAPNEDLKDSSLTGMVTATQDSLVDVNMDFGFEETNNPQFLQAEFNKGWYYIRLNENEYKQLYTIREVVDNHTLLLDTHDVNENTVPWSAPESEVDVGYDVLWNSVHLKTRVPNNNS